jgi:hypothetical protein
MGRSYFRNVVTQGNRSYSYDQYRGIFVTYLDAAGSPVYFRHLPTAVEINQPPHGNLLGDKLLLTLYSDPETTYNVHKFVKKVEDVPAKLMLRHVVLDPQGMVKNGGNRLTQQLKSKRVKPVDVQSGVVSPSGDAVYFYTSERGDTQLLRVSLPQ